MKFSSRTPSKCLLYFISCICLVSDVFMIYSVITSYTTFAKYYETGNYSTLTLFIAASSILLIIVLIGCYGIYENKMWALKTFAAFLSITFILNVGGSITAFFYKDLRTTTKDYLQENLEKYSETKEKWNTIQQELKCCGIENAHDWSRIPQFQNRTLPESCCDKNSETCVIDSENFRQKYGCLESLKDFIDDKLIMLGSVAIGMAFTQFLGIVSVCRLTMVGKKNLDGKAKYHKAPQTAS
ncbi:CD63 antigen-like [Tachypleus tridentatus]|uniref:CD63 antigen-like n=1 Tax=Tachypleus tridentatus TaxID=6853 RepID=UPI003FD00516